MEASSPDVSYTLPEDRLLVATRAWLLFIQGLFRTRPPGHYRWSSNAEESEIIITDQSPTSLENTNKRPIISTARGPATYSGTSLAQAMQPVFESPKKIIADLLGSSITISVVAREGLEAQSIAYTLFRMIPIFKPQIMRLGRLHAIGNNITLTQETQHGQIVPGSSTPEWKMVQLIIPFYIQEVISAEEKDFYSLAQAVNLHMGLE